MQWPTRLHILTMPLREFSAYFIKLIFMLSGDIR